MPLLDLAGAYGSDTRPARVSSDRKPWAKDPTQDGASDGTRLDATFVNDLVGMLRALGTTYGVTQTPGDDDYLADVITAAVQASVDGVIGAAPGALDTLDELAAALGDDADFAGTVTTALAAKQPLDAELTAIAGLVSAADRLPYFTGSGTAALATFTSFGRSLVDDADASAARTTLALVPGTNVQAYDATLASLSALGTAADKIAYTTGIDTWAEAAITAAGRSMIAAADAAAQTALLAAFTSGAKGLAPASGGGTSNFLRADGTWAAPPGGSTYSGGDLSSAAGIVAGAAATPGLYIVGDTNTGLYSPGTDRLTLVTGGVGRWEISASGHLIGVTDNTYDIGQLGATRPRNGYFAGNVYAGNRFQALTGFQWTNGMSWETGGNGNAILQTNSATDALIVKFGYNDVNHPALKRPASTASLQVRLADDSADAPLKASILEASTSIKFPDATTQTTAATSKLDLVGSWTYSTGVASVEITWTADTYNEIFVVFTDLSPAAPYVDVTVSLRNGSGAIVSLSTTDLGIAAADSLSGEARFAVGIGGTRRSTGVATFGYSASTFRASSTATNATAADRIRVAFSSGNIDAGSIRVYGFKAS